MQEILPGVVHWTAPHPKIRTRVSSYYLTGPRVLVDPLAPEEGFQALAQRYGEPLAVVLTNRHHYRQAGEVVERYGASVHCHEAGLHEFTHGEVVFGFRAGDELPGGGVAYGVGAICPDETALWWPDLRALSVADGLVRMPPDGDPGFVPDQLMGDDAAAVKRGLREAYGELTALDPEHLLLAHGLPIVGDGRAVLEQVAGPA
jgi:hypothetical protein